MTFLNINTELRERERERESAGELTNTHVREKVHPVGCYTLCVYV